MPAVAAVKKGPADLVDGHDLGLESFLQPIVLVLQDDREALVDQLDQCLFNRFVC